MSVKEATATAVFIAMHIKKINFLILTGMAASHFLSHLSLLGSVLANKANHTTDTFNKKKNMKNMFFCRFSFRRFLTIALRVNKICHPSQIAFKADFKLYVQPLVYNCNPTWMKWERILVCMYVWRSPERFLSYIQIDLQPLSGHSLMPH